MKRTVFWLVTLVSRWAGADTSAPAPIAKATAPAIAASLASCSEDQPYMTTRELTAKGIHLEAFQDCLSTDQDGWLAIDYGDTHLTTQTTQVGYMAGNMTDAPESLSMTSDALELGTLQHGEPAALLTINLRDAFLCRTENPGCKDRIELRQFAMVCTLPAAPATPVCASVARACPGRSCPAASLKSGVLTVAGQRVALTP
jgi:hypothetical protein